VRSNSDLPVFSSRARNFIVSDVVTYTTPFSIAGEEITHEPWLPWRQSSFPEFASSA